MATPLFEPGAPDVLVVVDLSAHLFRAYHAIQPLSSPDGEPTHAVYGTVTMLERIIKDLRPQRFAIALDSGRTTFRNDLYPAYKANRPEPPEDLVIQIRRAAEVVRAFTPHVWQKPGFEADDIIATAVRRSKQSGFRVLIVGADKDLMQLVSDDVRLWDTMRDRVFGPPEVQEKFGVSVEALGDFLALVGDTSDNVPGVPSVGPKTAADLLSRFGSLDGIFSNLERIERKKLRDTLAEHEASARLCRRLVTLASNLDDTLDQDGAPWSGRDVDRLRSLYTVLGFQRLAKALPVVVSSSTGSTRGEGQRAPMAVESTAALGPPRLLSRRDDLTSWLERAQRTGRIAVHVFRRDDAATRSPWSMVGLASGFDEFAVVPMSELAGARGSLAPEESIQLLRRFLQDQELRVVTHGAKRLWLALLDQQIDDVHVDFDTELAGYLVDSDRQHDLESLCGQYLGTDGVPVVPTPASAPSTENADRIQLWHRAAAHRAAWMLKLADRLSERLEEARLASLFRDLELPLARVLARMQRRGVLLDTGQLTELSRHLDQEMSKLELEIEKLAGRAFNVNSPRQLETILFDELGLKPKRRTKTARSTDAATLELLSEQHPLPRAILEHRHLAKLKGTYVDALPKLVDTATGRVHTSWEQTVAATGRLSSIAPNLQNIPIRTPLGRSIRRAFIAPEGKRLVSADYSQIELRVLAHLSGDPELSRAFQTGQDVHLATAAGVFGVDESAVTAEMRRRAKAVNFGIIYGQSDAGLASSLGITRLEAGSFIASYYRRYAGVQRFMNETLQQARAGQEVRSLLGRRRFVSQIVSANRSLRLAAERIAMNTPIQATAADILKLAMLRLDDQVTPGTEMLLSVHDELVFETPADEVNAAREAIERQMQQAVDLAVPLMVDVAEGTSWADAHR